MTDPVVTITLQGAPRGQGRHRSRIIFPKDGRKPFATEYPDPETAKYSELVANAARLAMLGIPVLDEALSVFVEAHREVPVSWSKKNRADALAGLIMPTSTPDDDNYLKMRDALNGIVWRDDSLVVMSQVLKKYSETPMWRISVWKWFDGSERAPEQPNLIGDFD